jgi:hypothetical protein
MLAMTLLISSMLFWKILDLAVSTKGDLLYQWHYKLREVQQVQN